MQNTDQYKSLLSEVIKKQIVILGPDITLAKAKNVPGLTVDDNGTVTDISGEPEKITQNLIDQFVQLSELIVKKTMEPLLLYHEANSAANNSSSLQSTSQTLAKHDAAENVVIDKTLQDQLDNLAKQT